MSRLVTAGAALVLLASMLVPVYLFSFLVQVMNR